MKKITAYDYIQSLQKFEEYLSNDKLFSLKANFTKKELARIYCNDYFNEEFIRGYSDFCNTFIPKEELNYYELELFRYHNDFVEVFPCDYFFKGYKLLKKKEE